jgi:hypothetical protein
MPSTVSRCGCGLLVVRDEGVECTEQATHELRVLEDVAPVDGRLGESPW